MSKDENKKNKTIALRMNSKLHEKATEEAKKLELGLCAYIRLAIMEKLSREIK